MRHELYEWYANKYTKTDKYDIKREMCNHLSEYLEKFKQELSPEYVFSNPEELQISKSIVYEIDIPTLLYDDIIKTNNSFKYKFSISN